MRRGAEVTITFQTLGPRLLLLQKTLLFLSMISFTIGDKADSDLILSTSSPEKWNDEGKDAAAAEERLSLVFPKKLALFAMALGNVVESQCPKVDDLELDTFQAYLSRQILNGDVQTMRHPLHFNSLYKNITSCAAAVTSTSVQQQEQQQPTSNHYLDGGDVDDDDGDRGEDNPDRNDVEKSNKRNNASSIALPAIDSILTSPTTSESSHQLSISKEENESYTLSPENLPKIKVLTGSDIQLENSSNRSDASINAKFQNAPKGVLVLKKARESNTSKQYPQSTILDKIFFNATEIATKTINKLKNALQEFWSTLTKDISFSARQKRDLEDLKEEMVVGEVPIANNKNPSPSFYSKVSISSLTPSNQGDKKEDYKENNYNQIWNSVTATETKITAYFHVIHLLKLFSSVAIESCSEQFQIDESFLDKACELMAASIMEDLLKAESNGLYLRINDKLENDLGVCLVNLALKMEQK